MKRVLLAGLLMGSSPALAGTVVDGLLAEYQVQGAGAFDAERGRQQWTETHMQEKLGKPVSCASCHTTDLTRTGEHIKTGKRIEPLAVRANAERLTDAAKIEKWFTRNCNWTYGRACTPQEKGDFLMFIQNY